MVRLICLLLLMAVSSSSLAQQKAKPQQPSGLSLHGLKQAISHFWEGRKGLLCADCVQLAMAIDEMLYKPAAVDSGDLNIAAPGPGRRMKIQHKESEIYAALDAACGRLGDSKGLSGDVVRDCQRLMTAHRRALEDAIFSRGTDSLAATMCVAQFKLCNQHHLMDSGEL